MNKMKVVQIGLGPLGQKITQFIVQRKNLEVVSAIDISPEIIGRDLGELCGLDNMGIIIQSSIGECLRSVKPDAVILTTVSTMEKITPQIEEIVSHGIPVISTCEELSYPWDTSLILSERIDTVAKENKVAVLGTGVNPGFLMDSLPTFLTSVCQDVQTITVHRIQDATFRRIPFQRKIGAGLTLEQFESKKKEGNLRHVGLTESIRLIANRLGWELSKTQDILVPAITDREIITDTMRIPIGYAAGVQQIGKGYVGNEDKIILVFRASVGEPNPYDSIEIKGTPTIKSTIEGGLNGDVATCAITINALKQIIKTQPGLRTMADIPMVSFFS
jgi:4-hydroxy-tetrahydrodipicolinate reductase